MGIGGQRKVSSARGEVVDFDLLMIKQQLAAAPSNIEVARRQEFIDNKEKGKSTKVQPQKPVEENQPLHTKTPEVVTVPTSVKVDDFENTNDSEPLPTKISTKK
jgi:hypothetical protein